MSDEDQQVSGVNWGWFAIVASIIAIVGGTTYFLLPSLISKTVTNITVVKAIDAPIKIKPLDSGGEVDVSQKDNSRAHVKTTGYFRFKG